MSSKNKGFLHVKQNIHLLNPTVFSYLLPLVKGKTNTEITELRMYHILFMPHQHSPFLPCCANVASP